MRLIDMDELLKRMKSRCDLYCQHKERPCRRECVWHEAMDEVDDSPEFNAQIITATDNGIAVGVIKGGVTIQRTYHQKANEIVHIGNVGVFNG